MEMKRQSDYQLILLSKSKSIVSFEIKKSMYCGVEFYSLYIDNKLHENYNTLKEAKKSLFLIISFTLKP